MTIDFDNAICGHAVSIEVILNAINKLPASLSLAIHVVEKVTACCAGIEAVTFNDESMTSRLIGLAPVDNRLAHIAIGTTGEAGLRTSGGIIVDRFRIMNMSGATLGLESRVHVCGAGVHLCINAKLLIGEYVQHG